MLRADDGFEPATTWRVMLYQLSHVRAAETVPEGVSLAALRTAIPAVLQTRTGGNQRE